jgi:hypothetical protein
MRILKCFCTFAALFLLGLSSIAEETASPLNITEISLQRSGGKEGGPQDTLTLRSDGSAAYTGLKNVPRIGEYQGKIPDWYFHDSFPQLAEMYAAIHGTGVSTGKPTESVTVVTLRVTVDGKQKEITDLCPGIDQRLWALEMSARGVAADIPWEKRSAK